MRNVAPKGLDMSVLLVCTAISAACSSTSDPKVNNSCTNVSVDELKELVVIDEAVLSDGRAKNGTTGAWSFRHAVQNLSPQDMDAGEFVRDWFVHWVSETEFNGYPLDRPNEDRVLGMNQHVLCPWLKGSPENACNDDCSTCSGQKLDLARAPFRLIGIANRMDVREQRSNVVNGEGRFIYALTDGPADDPASKPLPMTVIFEYALPAERTAGQWAKAWHALGQFPSFDEGYRAALQSVTDGFSVRGAHPEGMAGSALGQVRTNEAILNWIWQLREFGLSSDGTLRLRPIWNTPAERLNGSAVLRDFVLSNADAIRSNNYEIPVSMRGGSVDSFRFAWNIPGVDAQTSKAFTEGTCNGCHSTNPTVDTAFHISPFREGPSRLSQHLVEDLKLRSASLRRALCTD
ncbi:hypothetical protein LZC95_31085 [Pendulispora brunnea]|uniref:Cytochrome c domain-containing protein n=1 Tax=Pendulispora brunnea TaxID=2905690 RepID=A0ABZ2JWN2_9BACT